ncbi:uncharacterized protein LOC142226066 [Haematobia irritans]|uniref:uncharacterized protein LOC142226066 n=1 Tax=Haematobia irritans TaxID=7368 RepID=UPI003F4FD0CB
MSLEKFIRLSDRLVEFEAELNDKDALFSSPYVIEIHKAEIKDMWERLRLVYEQCLSDLEVEAAERAALGDDSGGSKDSGKARNDDETANEVETVRSKFKSAYATYCRCNEQLGERLQVMPSKSSASPPKEAHGFKLPPCEIPIFSGDYQSWPTFRDVFSAVCISNSRLSPVEKLFHLGQRTKGEPHDIVKKLPLTNENFRVAWDNLCSRYENRRVLVNLQLKSLFNLPTIQTESGTALKNLQRDMNACISLLKLYEIDVGSWDPIFVFVCCNRLPDITLTLWEQTLADKTVIPKWTNLDSFLTNRHRTLESVTEIRRKDLPLNGTPKPHNSEKSVPKSVGRTLKTFQNKVSELKCRLCPSETHVVRHCPKFLDMSVNQRLTEIKKRNLCLNCFSRLHSVKNCNSKFSCYRCSKRHNTLLHRDEGATNTEKSIPATPSTTPPIQSTITGGNVQACFAMQSKGVLLGTALVSICHNGLVYTARALIDSGSEGTFVSEKLFNTLKLPFKRTCAKISGLNYSMSASVQKECSLIMRSRLDDSVEVTASALVVPHLASCLPSGTIHPDLLGDLPDLHLADPRFFECSKIDLLIGGDLLPSIMLPGIKREICGSLMAQQTIFGWILTGPVPSHSTPTSTSIVSYFCEISVEADISRFWEVEDFPKKTFHSSSDRYCETLYTSTTVRDPEGRYVVSLPFKDETSSGKIGIGQSRSSALAQFFRNENRLLRSPELKEEYDRVLMEYISLGHMSKVSPPTPNDMVSYYLPHHAVIKPDSTTTKVRVVFNASSPSSNGRSLNDILYTGPVLQQDLVVLILKWRFFTYVFNGDITKMYRQVLVNPNHRSYQRVLFRHSPSEPIQDYELTTVTFGVNCAPFLAIRTIMQLAEDVKDTLPFASTILRNYMYVDDALAGAYSISDAITARSQLVEALKSAGFSMRKWTSNSKDIISDLPPSDLLCEDFLEFDDRSTAKTLGIRWNASTDSFFFSISPFPESCNYTKREVLSQIAKLFDPAGWLAPVIIIAKIIMQNIWAEGTKWDEVISSDSLLKWKSFQSAYGAINHIQIPRWFDYTPLSEIEFHGFSDASVKAYSAALYIRVKRAQSIYTHLVCCKTKVAPLKTLSIPRLELCGATLLAEMIDHFIPQLQIKSYSIFCWTDSTIVLSWLAKPPCFWTTFVANRVSKISEVIAPSNWYHVPSDSNPADLASRGIYPSDLVQNNLWWKGPSWLQDQSDHWPKLERTFHEPIEIERKIIKVNFLYFTAFVDVLERFSSLEKALRVISYVYRFFHATHPKFRTNYKRETINISTSEVMMAQDRIVVMTQKAYFPRDYFALSTKESISPSSPLLSLNPFLDSEGIMRICGRLVNSSQLSYNERHPIIIPYNCRFSHLLVQFVHKISLHGGNQLVLRLIRTQFWIIKAKNFIKCVINKCKPCILYKKRCQRQIMSALPPERSEISRPFTHTGLDFTGPFEIKNYSGRACRITKGYVCVFICFSTKAIHLEATSDLSTNTFLAAFERFVSRRGCPLHLHSDNGTNFVGAAKTLAKNFVRTSQEAIEANYAHQKITWHFIPPGAPHMGGLWEAGVKSFKSHFRKVAGNFKHTFEEFQTLLSKIEACLNSRPLCATSQNPNDLSALTPGHFLIGSPILMPMDPNMREAPMSLVNRWQRLCVIHQHFCLRWKEEYLKELHGRYKWKTPSENLKEGLIVIIKDENLPPNAWRMGRLNKVYPGPDGKVRVVELYTEKGMVTRPITKIVVLPTDPSSAQNAPLTSQETTTSH